ncbi:hypothetical protein CBR_g36829 [Chara braunii]|uniref:5'-nucleotidase n=1 Tax=Chara braunii TaxID=69332 RepID=A0A388LLW2_CHABU|nr:hypothetical protein CBR_g36829 [Chara braunii]|eukprot:GBG83215.1 hypothetical protein CBR_g36829 [Chara braunii]
MRRGRVKIEGPGVASYVAKTREAAQFMLLEGQVEVSLGTETYRLLFKPWMTRAEFRDLRRQEDENVFWVIALQIPLDVMPFIYAQIEKVIGKIVLAHPTDADPARPALVNAKFDLEPEARANMKDVLWIETSKGDTLEVRLASSGTPKCRKCRQFFHTEDECRRGVRSGFQGAPGRAGASSSQAQGYQHQPAASVPRQGSYQGSLAPSAPNQVPPAGGLQGGFMRNNPMFSPGTGGGGQSGALGTQLPGPFQSREVLARRLGKYLPALVAANRAAFVSGTSIHENIVTVIEILEVVRQEDLDMAVLLLDMEKAYDRVNWSYVLTTLRWMGFGEVFCSWVIALYSLSTASVMVNGHISSEFKLSRLLRQGCPLAPLLFVVHLEVPLNNIREHCSIVGLGLGQQSCRVKALADDLFAVTENTLESMTALRQCLSQYEILSETAINWSKSVYFLPSQRTPAVDWGMKRVQQQDSERFLGVQVALSSCVTRQEEILQNKVLQRMSTWGKAPHLSLIGRVLVINVVFFALLTFVGNVRPLGKKTLAVVKWKAARFVWKPFADEEENVMPKVAWDLICVPRSEGGLGMIDPWRRNTAMLAQWVVRAICLDKDPHWVLLGERILSREWNLHLPADVWACVWMDSYLRRRISSEFWQAVLRAWRKVKPDQCCAPKTKAEVLSQVIFENQNIRDQRGQMLMATSSPGSFGKAWVERGVTRLRDLWNTLTGSWLCEEELEEKLRPTRYIKERKRQVLEAIPEEWHYILDPAQVDPVGTWYETVPDEGGRLFLKSVEISEEDGRKFQQWRAQGLEGVLVHHEEEETLIKIPRGQIHEIRVRESVDEEGTWKVVLWNHGQSIVDLRADPDQWGWRGRGLKGDTLMLDGFSLKLAYELQKPPKTPLLTATERWQRVYPEETERIHEVLPRCWEQLAIAPNTRAATLLWLESLLATPSAPLCSSDGGGGGGVVFPVALMSLATPRPLANGLPSRSRAARFLRGLAAGSDRHPRGPSLYRPYQDIREVIRRQFLGEEEEPVGDAGGAAEVVAVPAADRIGGERGGDQRASRSAVKCPASSPALFHCRHENPCRLVGTRTAAAAAIPNAYAVFAESMPSSHHLRGKRGGGGGGRFLSRQCPLAASKSSTLDSTEHLGGGGGGGGWSVVVCSRVCPLSSCLPVQQHSRSSVALRCHSQADAFPSSSSCACTSASSTSSSPLPASSASGSQPATSTSTAQTSAMSPSVPSLSVLAADASGGSSPGGRRSIATAATAAVVAAAAANGIPTCVAAVRPSTSLSKLALEASASSPSSSVSTRCLPDSTAAMNEAMRKQQQQQTGREEEGGGDVRSGRGSSWPRVLIGNVEELERKKKAIRLGGRSKLQVIADFDMTLTKFRVNGRKGQTCHALLSQENPEYDRKRQQLYEHYYPLEICPDLSYEDKFRYMEEWWTKVHGLLVEGGLQRSAIRASVGSANIEFREGCTELFALLEQLEVPLLIFSAGLADIIEEVMLQRIHRQFANITVVSNRMAFDEQGSLTGFVGKTIHILNKNEHALQLMMLSDKEDGDEIASTPLGNDGSDEEGRSDVSLGGMMGNGAVGGLSEMTLRVAGGGEESENEGRREEEENGGSVSWSAANRRIDREVVENDDINCDLVVNGAGHVGVETKMEEKKKMKKKKERKASMRERTNVILLGDHVGDLGMSDGLSYENRITVGFLNDNVETRSRAYMQAFDVVVVGDGPMTPVVDILREVV